MFAISGCESEAFGMSFRCSEPMIQKHLSFTVSWFSETFVLSHQLHKIQTALENCTSKVQTAINNRLTFIEKPAHVLLNGNIVNRFTELQEIKTTNNVTLRTIFVSIVTAVSTSCCTSFCSTPFSPISVTIDSEPSHLLKTSA